MRPHWLKNPVCLAPAYFPTTQSFSKVGAIFTKSVTLQPNEGFQGGELMMGASTAFTTSLINRCGLPSKGLDHFLRVELAELSQHKVPIVVSVAPRSPAELLDLLAPFVFVKDQIKGIEVNLSCPNTANEPVDLVTTTLICAAVSSVDLEGLMVSLKLPPYLDLALEIASVARERGINAFSCCNTLPGLVRETPGEKKWFKGGVSGDALRPVAQRVCHELRQLAPDAIIFGVGGVASRADVNDYLDLGADAVQIATAEILRPGAAATLASFYT